VSTLKIEDLCTEFTTRAGVVKAVNNVSFEVDAGQIMGLVGESGSGKSITGYSIMGLIDKPGRISGGRILFKGQDLCQVPEHEMRAIRGNRIAMIFQDPMMTLNPVLRIDTQMLEAIHAHQKVSPQTARDMAREALGRVGIPSPDERLLAYPHQFSGGMRQRVAIAIALLNKPELIICDEPTTALDVTIQGQILFEMQKICKEQNTALIWITHDLSVVAGLADTLSVMYAGSVVESGTVAQVLDRPLHPYTAGLIASAPSRNARGKMLTPIPGMTPSLINLPVGCAFYSRCQHASATCNAPPALSQLKEDGGTRSYRCFYPLVDNASDKRIKVLTDNLGVAL
jgi:peptide/nickel transport system ATP-binding protein